MAEGGEKERTLPGFPSALRLTEGFEIMESLHLPRGGGEALESKIHRTRCFHCDESASKFAMDRLSEIGKQGLKLFGDDGPFLRRFRVTGQLVHPHQGELVETRGGRIDGQLRGCRTDRAPVLIRSRPGEGKQGGESGGIGTGGESFGPPCLEQLQLQCDAGGTAQPRVRMTEVGPGLRDSVPIDPAVKTLELFPELARGSSITGIGDGLFARLGTIDFFPGVANAI